METRKCSKCGGVKSLDCFGINRANAIGIEYHCKECVNKTGQEYKRSKKGLVSVFYTHQKQSSKTRNHPAPSYSKDDLRDWLFSQQIFHELYDNWVVSGYDKYKKPSCDRKNDYIPYTLSNLRLVTWQDNLDKCGSDKINGLNNKMNKAVIGTHLITGEVIEFYSMAEADRHFGVKRSSIIRCVRGKGKSSHGYKWEYSNN